jgi:hypothetical protein
MDIHTIHRTLCGECTPYSPHNASTITAGFAVIASAASLASLIQNTSIVISTPFGEPREQGLILFRVDLAFQLN